MKTAIVYYSLEGNTEYTAEKIAEQLKQTGETDILRIEPEKAYPDKGAGKFFWGGKSAVMGEKPTLKPYEFDVENFEAELILIDPKANVKAEDDVKIAEFCAALGV